MSFSAVAGDASVALEWRTASELDNLGFHLYRGLVRGRSVDAAHVVAHPGSRLVGVGQAYSFRDAGLANGTRYFYRLEDVDASSKTTSHGPVSAVPLAGGSGGRRAAAEASRQRRKKARRARVLPRLGALGLRVAPGAAARRPRSRCTRHGDPEAVSLEVVSRDSRQATLELRTGGFYALREASGTVRVFVPGFEFPQDAQAAALPFRRALVDAVVGRRVAARRRARARPGGASRASSRRALGKAEMQVVVGRHRARRPARVACARAAAVLDGDLARLLPSVFQGETKSAVVEISPLRFDARRQQLLLARRVRLRLLFSGRETAESGRGSLGPRAEAREARRRASCWPGSTRRAAGFYAVSFEQLFPGRAARPGRSRAAARASGRGGRRSTSSRLRTPSVRAASSTSTPTPTPARPTSRPRWPSSSCSRARACGCRSSRRRRRGGASRRLRRARPFETNRFYQPGLLDAPDPWLWEALASGTTRVKSFSLTGVSAAAAQAAQLEVFLQGASESGSAVDHHVSVSVNGTLVGEAQFAGKQPYRMSLSVPASLLREGANELSAHERRRHGRDVARVPRPLHARYPQASSLAGGRLRGDVGRERHGHGRGRQAPRRFSTSRRRGCAVAHAATQASGGSLRFRAEAGHRYLAVSPQGLLTPRVATPAAVHAARDHEPGRLPADRAARVPRGGRAAARSAAGTRASRRAPSRSRRSPTSSGTASPPRRRSGASWPTPSSPGRGPRRATCCCWATRATTRGTSWARRRPRRCRRCGRRRATCGPRPTRCSPRSTARTRCPTSRSGGSRPRPSRKPQSARREAPGLGGLGPGPLGSGGARGRQPRPRRRLRGGRARHRAELPRRQGSRSCCC